MHERESRWFLENAPTNQLEVDSLVCLTFMEYAKLTLQEQNAIT